MSVDLIVQPVLSRMLLEAALEGGPRPKDPIAQRRLRWLPEWLRALVWQQIRTTPQEIVQAFLVSMHAQRTRPIQRGSLWGLGALPRASASPADASEGIGSGEIPARLLAIAPVEPPPLLADPRGAAGNRA